MGYSLIVIRVIIYKMFSAVGDCFLQVAHSMINVIHVTIRNRIYPHLYRIVYDYLHRPGRGGAKRHRPHGGLLIKEEEQQRPRDQQSA